jgi:hypothetical protein
VNPASLLPVAADSPAADPNLELLRIHGWAVIATDGLYCSAWKGSREVLLVWADGRWKVLISNSGVAR